jgi:hypothetical protein
MIVYTRPPYPDIKYPHLIVNVFDESSFRYVNPKYVESVIIDSGVHSIFHRHKLKEYPGGYQAWIGKVVRWWSSIRNLIDEVYAVIPDYPSDYEDNQIDDNVERTIRNIEYAVRRYPDVKWIVPIQGKKDDVVSVVKMYEYVVDMGVLDRYDYIAIAPTCVTRTIKFLSDVAVIMRKRVKQIENNKRYIKIHMFGTDMRSWKHIVRYIDSTDTIVTNYLCLSLTGKMCTKRKEKERAWQIFLQRVSEVSKVNQF